MKGHLAAKIGALLLGVLLLLSSFVGCADSNTALTVGEEKVSYDLLRYFIMNYRRDAGYTAEEYAADETLREELVEQVNRTLREVMAYQAIAEEEKIKLTDEEEESLEATLTAMKAEYATEEELAAALEEAYLTEDLFMELQRLQILASKVYNYLTDEHGGIIPTDEATIRADVEQGNFFSAEYLYIYYTESGKDERVQFANELYAELMAGATMQEVNDKYAATYGLAMEYVQLNAFTYTQQYEDFEEAVLALEVGEYTQPIVRGDGILIARRLELAEEYVEENFDEIIASYKEREFARYVEAYGEKMEIALAKEYESLKYWEME